MGRPATESNTVISAAGRMELVPFPPVQPASASKVAGEMEVATRLSLIMSFIFLGVQDTRRPGGTCYPAAYHKVSQCCQKRVTMSFSKSVFNQQSCLLFFIFGIGRGLNS